MAAEATKRFAFLVQVLGRPEADDLEVDLRAVVVAKGEIRDESRLTLVEDVALADQTPAVAGRTELVREGLFETGVKLLPAPADGW